MGKSRILKRKYKEYRIDLSKWEEKFIFFHFISIYRYSIWKDGYLRVKWRLHKKRNAEYFHRPKADNFLYPIGRQEFKEKYHSNKWLIPINCRLDLNRP